ncbi:MAG: HesA/MoeB/ThiF family protein [Bacteroidota bacterium]
MFSEEEVQRYSRQFILPGFGKKAQEKLKASAVLVVGAGGLGCPILQYLVAAGVGRVGIVDGDHVSMSNLHRQILYTTEDIGSNKAYTAMVKLQQMNPHVTFDAYEEFLTNENALEILADYDVIVDGSDNFEARYLVNDACVMLDKPFVYGAVLTYEGQVSVFNLDDGPTYRCLFPTPPKPEESPNCAEIGVLGVLPGLIGSHQALETLKVLTGIGECLSGRLQLINGLTNSSYTIKIKPIPENKQIDALSDYQLFCGSKPSGCPLVEPTKLKEKLAKEPLLLVDVREPHEYDAFNIGGKNIPLSDLENQLDTLSTSEEIILICQSGMRSEKGCLQLMEKGYTRVASLQGGLDQWRG